MIIIWDGAKGNEICRLAGHRQWVTSLSWEPLHLNGKCERLASSSRDGTVVVWNVNTRRKEMTISGHSDSIECCKWSGENLIYTASRDRTIRVWSPEGPTGKLVRTLIGHAHRINALSLNSDYVLRTGGFDWEKKSFASDEEMVECAKKKYAELRKNGPERLCSCSDDFEAAGGATHGTPAAGEPHLLLPRRALHRVGVVRQEGEGVGRRDGEVRERRRDDG